MESFIASAASFRSVWNDLDHNLEKISESAIRAANDNARLLLLPECCLTGADWPTGVKTPSLESVAVTTNSPAMDRVHSIAQSTGLFLSVGFYETHDGRLSVSQALIGPNGIAGVYRKVHEGRYSSCDADLFPVFDIGFARIGTSICYDNMFPECSRILALKGADVVLSPFTSLPFSRAMWRQMRLVALRARAQDNRLFILSASHAMERRADKADEWGYSGICCAIDPLGRVIAESKGVAGKSQRIVVELDERMRRTYFIGDVPALRNRRPEDYRELVDSDIQKKYMMSAPVFKYNDSETTQTVDERRDIPN
ncbi:MAG: carbon-nitrogen hydrolase family protein [Planctomycetota bacterium]